MTDLLDYKKLAPKMVLEHCLSSLEKGERTLAKAELMSRCLEHVSPAYREKVGAHVEVLLTSLVGARKKRNLTELVALEREILIQMTGQAAPRPAAPSEAKPLPEAAVPEAGSFDRKQMHDFFLASAEHHKRAAQEMEQYAALCLRHCERLRPELYEKKGAL